MSSVNISPPWGLITSLINALYRVTQREVALEGSATLCTWGYPMIFLGGPDPALPLHIDVNLKAWNQTAERLSLIDIASAEINGQQLVSEWYPSFDAETLEPGESAFAAVLHPARAEGDGP